MSIARTFCLLTLITALLFSSTLCACDVASMGAGHAHSELAHSHHAHGAMHSQNASPQSCLEPDCGHCLASVSAGDRTHDLDTGDAAHGDGTLKLQAAVERLATAAHPQRAPPSPHTSPITRKDRLLI